MQRIYRTRSERVAKECYYSLQSRQPIPHKFETDAGEEQVFGTVVEMYQVPEAAPDTHEIVVEVVG